jgi:hypothetical protein
LQQLEFTSHQNDHVAMLGQIMDAMMEYVLPRSVAVVYVHGPRLLTSDEPVIVNTGGDHMHHHPDCSLPDADIEKRVAKEARKNAKRRKEVGRTVHIYPTKPSGVGDAIELAMPISPNAALLYGPTSDSDGTVRFEHLRGEEAEEFASRVNDAMCRWALDVVVAHPDDSEFPNRTMPPLEPLVHVCDGTSVASEVANRVPEPIRPARLWRSP